MERTYFKMILESGDSSANTTEPTLIDPSRADNDAPLDSKYSAIASGGAADQETPEAEMTKEVIGMVENAVDFARKKVNISNTLIESVSDTQYTDAGYGPVFECVDILTSGIMESTTAEEAFRPAKVLYSHINNSIDRNNKGLCEALEFVTSETIDVLEEAYRKDRNDMYIDMTEGFKDTIHNLVGKKQSFDEWKRENASDMNRLAKELSSIMRAELKAADVPGAMIKFPPLTISLRNTNNRDLGPYPTIEIVSSPNILQIDTGSSEMKYLVAWGKGLKKMMDHMKASPLKTKFNVKENVSNAAAVNIVVKSKRRVVSN